MARKGGTGKLTMTDKRITWGELEAKLSIPDDVKKVNRVRCPVCGEPRNKGKHRQCAKATQLKYMRERGEI